MDMLLMVTEAEYFAQTPPRNLITVSLPIARPGQTLLQVQVTAVPFSARQIVPCRSKTALYLTIMQDWLLIIRIHLYTKSGVVTAAAYAAFREALL